MKPVLGDYKISGTNFTKYFANERNCSVSEAFKRFYAHDIIIL
jgi:hypothetical protein